ncbi:MAG: 50S ribosomal protein L4 [Bryobacterales bacterium]|nr:50S ribosomal protein L4 [Bryobacterales bacterium]
MPTVSVVDLKNEPVGTVDLADAVFGTEPNEHLVHQVVVAYQANQRAGTHKVKERGEVSGSGRKPWRQKGVGRARTGSRRSPLWRGGGTVHGPRPRSYRQKVPRKMVAAALRSSLSARLAESCITVVRDLDLETHKTRDFRAALEVLGLGRNVLVVETDPGRNLRLSSRNLPEVRLAAISQLNAYVVLKYRRILMSERAARVCSEVLA